MTQVSRASFDREFFSPFFQAFLVFPGERLALLKYRWLSFQVARSSEEPFLSYLAPCSGYCNKNLKF